MKGARPALRYAKAILNLAKEQGKESEVNTDMKLVAATIAENKELSVMLKSPVVKISNKERVLDTIFRGRVDNLTLGLFNLLKENKRLDILESTAKQYTIIYDYLKSIKVAKVTTAIPLSKELEAKILEKIISLTGNKASIENIVNPDILGGFILRVGDVQYDASISNHFNTLRRKFDNEHFVSKI